MKKVGKVILGMFGLAVVGTVAFAGVDHHFLNDKYSSELSKRLGIDKFRDIFDKDKDKDKEVELTPEQKEEDNKEKEKEQELIKEIEEDVEDKKPEDIIIPEDATEEEKKELEQEKEYWTVVNDFKDKANQDLAEKYIKGEGGLGPSEMEYGFKTIRKINNIFVDHFGSAYLFCDYIYDKELNNGETVLNQCSAIIMVENNNISISTDSNLSDIINLLNDSNTKFSIRRTMCSDYEYLDEFVANHVEYYEPIVRYRNAGRDYKIIQCGHGEEYQDGRPTEFKVLYERNNGESYTYFYFEIQDLNHLNKEDWEDYVLNQKTFDGLFAFNKCEYESLNINFEELNEKYQQSNNQAQASSEQSFETENGFDAVAYYDNIEQQDIQKHVDKQGANYDFNSNLINNDDFGLSL